MAYPISAEGWYLVEVDRDGKASLALPDPLRANWRPDCSYEVAYHDGREWTDATARRVNRAGSALLGACFEAAEAFRQYEALHRAKKTKDGDEKADRNAKLAERIEAAIEKALPTPPPDLREVTAFILAYYEMASYEREARWPAWTAKERATCDRWDGARAYDGDYCDTISEYVTKKVHNPLLRAAMGSAEKPR